MFDKIIEKIEEEEIYDEGIERILKGLRERIYTMKSINKLDFMEYKLWLDVPGF